jgi:hypothetical protein
MTVAELGNRITATEFIEWRLYDELVGLPDRQADWRMGLAAALFANAHKKKGARPYRPDDFRPPWSGLDRGKSAFGRTRVRQSMDSLYDRLLQMSER